MVSLDSQSKRNHFLGQLSVDDAPYFWAGGKLSRDKKVLHWENGRGESIIRGRHPWSFAGSRGPQPDGLNSEHCLAILNNVYQVRLILLRKIGINFCNDQDGVKYHDVACDHTKPTVCEAGQDRP